MAEYRDREHFIPLRVSDLVDFLAADAGPTGGAPLGSAEAADFRRLAKLLTTHYHIAYHAQFSALKDIYAPLDPDTDTKALKPLAETDRAAQRDRVFDSVDKLLTKANYRKLSREEVMVIMEGASAWGLEMHVDWEVFERIEFYFRGDETIQRSRRSWKTLWQPKEFDVDVFKRLVLVIKQRAGKGLPDGSDTENVYLKLFKNMPKMDMEMVLPGTRVKLSRFDKAMILYPILFASGIVLYKIVSEILEGFNVSLPQFDMLKKVGGLSAIAILLGGYAYRSYASFSVKKTSYTLKLTQSLYYQTLDSNAGVLHRLLDDAEEQEVREALLAYYYLSRHAPAGGWTAEQLDDYIENVLQSKLSMKVDFEVADALGKLEALGILRTSGGKLSVVPLSEALRTVEGKSVAEAEASVAEAEKKPLSEREKLASFAL